MKGNTVSTILLVSGLVLLFISPVILIVGPLLCIGITDGEWGHLSRTGSFSAPDKLQWGAWQPSDDSITPFRGYQPDVEKPQFTQYRKGGAHGLLFDFVVYEGKAATADGDKVYPATGPAWGIRFHRMRVISAFFLGIGMIIASRFFRPRKNAAITEASAAAA